ncbi:tRNA lysidine(34) synthetase TilS [Polymorphobacter fuscus]|uniref:tRNA(Ile)-lysidine synthase n=1 Tax=Sandarakinorhabdus fusca TaxID=1439888 RepID=A0A7C9KY05_9SPHN|nr:tRNA lysidine(34) synthetase TilS [Polymorphobacter fuscus]KAB7645525.1 tRNA lysidine(34) synthetase TilS [Polymorphobacter fuscus]MQT17962.1 tRNA lysidine(34) synthetase TilS [Polymorphobacter fuscus]NJC08592.1 tRNA(Ile)-lysidine synthase [Polymorphobacter fuscus]
MPDIRPDIGTLTEAALGRALAPGEPLALAVSGGPDSLALLKLATDAFPGRVSALTVDHRLRAASAAEAAGVAALCAALGIPHAVLDWEAPKPGAGVQGAARAARYALMGGWCTAAGIGLLLTAHHADDQAETLLMRLARGSGIAGLSGIRAARPLCPGVTLVRPLLPLRRVDLAAIVSAAGWTAVDDPSNVDRRFERARVRALLAGADAPDAVQLAASARHLAAAEAALQWAADRAWAGGATVAGDGVGLDIAGLPDELVRRLVLRAIVLVDPAANVDGSAIATLVARLAAGDTATLAGVKARGGRVWQFNPAPPRRKTGRIAPQARQNRTG